VEIKVKTERIAQLLLERLRTNAGLVDHSLKDLRALGHPYSTARPQAIHSPEWLVHAQTRSLQDAIKIKQEGDTFTVYIDDAEAPHAQYVILGTDRMVSRDFVSATLYELRGEIQKILNE